MDFTSKAIIVIMKSIIIAILLLGRTFPYAQDSTNRSIAIEGNPVNIMRGLEDIKKSVYRQTFINFSKKV